MPSDAVRKWARFEAVGSRHHGHRPVHHWDHGRFVGSSAKEMSAVRAKLKPVEG
jgi:hypothetical protein